MANDDRACLRRLKDKWSDPQQTICLDIVAYSINQLRAMTCNGVMEFTEWWLSRLPTIELPDAGIFGGTIRAIIDMCPPPFHHDIQKLLRLTRCQVVIRQLQFPPVKKRKQLLSLETAMVSLLIQWTTRP